MPWRKTPLTLYISVLEHANLQSMQQFRPTAHPVAISDSTEFSLNFRNEITQLFRDMMGNTPPLPQMQQLHL